mgnify:CR=1 FL=1
MLEDVAGRHDLAALRETTSWTMANGMEDVRHALAGATPYVTVLVELVLGFALALVMLKALKAVL